MPDDDSADLETRVDELEATVSKLLPTRRQVLGGAAVGGAGVLLGSQRATAQAAGQVGTTTDPVDLVAYSLQDRSGTNAFIEVVSSGSVTLSSGSATVTVESASGSTYYLALGTDANAKVSGRVFDDGDVKVEIVETDTSVGNPTVEYDVLRVR